MPSVKFSKKKVIVSKSSLLSFLNNSVKCIQDHMEEVVVHLVSYLVLTHIRFISASKIEWKTTSAANVLTLSKIVLALASVRDQRVKPSKI